MIIMAEINIMLVVIFTWIGFKVGEELFDSLEIGLIVSKLLPLIILIALWCVHTAEIKILYKKY